MLDGGAGINTLAQAGNLSFTLSDKKLIGVGTDTLANLQIATLTGGVGKNIFTVSGWTGSGIIVGGDGTDCIVAVRDTDSTLNNSSLMSLGFGVLNLSGIETASLSGGNSANKLIANDFTSGPVTLNGGNGDDVLIAGSQNDSLNGGTGRDMLIGGLGADNLAGGVGDDILIGGTTSHASDLAALNAIMAEWCARPANATLSHYVSRVTNLSNGGGANGSTRLNNTTIQNDTAADRIAGNQNRDWLFQSSLDVLLDLTPAMNEIKAVI